MKKFDFRKFEYHMSPSFANIGGKKIILPMWEEVPQETTYADIYPLWINTAKHPVVTQSQDNEFQIPNSKNTGFYNVTLVKNQWSCNCVGYGFRRKCKHIEIAKSKI